MPLALEVYRERQKKVTDDEANSVVQQAASAHNLPRSGSKQLSLYRAYQSGTNPPAFTLVVNDPRLVHFSYQRYIENSLRQAFGFTGTPIQLIFKARR